MNKMDSSIDNSGWNVVRFCSVCIYYIKERYLVALLINQVAYSAVCLLFIAKFWFQA
jgi:hypothetical protein